MRRRGWVGRSQMGRDVFLFFSYRPLHKRIWIDTSKLHSDTTSTWARRDEETDQALQMVRPCWLRRQSGVEVTPQLVHLIPLMAVSDPAGSDPETTPNVGAGAAAEEGLVSNAESPSMSFAVASNKESIEIGRLKTETLGRWRDSLSREGQTDFARDPSADQVSMLPDGLTDFSNESGVSRNADDEAVRASS